MKHGFSSVAYSSMPIPNGTKNYKQLFNCDNARVTPNGPEEIISYTCNTGYMWDGTNCVSGGNTTIIETYSGTTCNTSNIQIVNVSPGTDKIPQNLNADTLYLLSAGQHNVTRKIEMNTCSAVVGMGTGATTVGYAGTSYDADNVFETTKNASIISKLTIDGQVASGKAKNGIEIK